MVLQNDVIPPTITCPSNQIEEVNAANCMFIIPDYTALATAQDGCNDQVVITQSPAPGTQVGLGTTTITLTASDGAQHCKLPPSRLKFKTQPLQMRYVAHLLICL